MIIILTGGHEKGPLAGPWWSGDAAWSVAVVPSVAVAHSQNDALAVFADSCGDGSVGSPAAAPADSALALCGLGNEIGIGVEGGGHGVVSLG